MKRIGLVLVAMMLCSWQGLRADAVDLTKPLEPDKDTILLFNLDDVAAGDAKEAVSGKTGKVVDAKEAEGKFGKALAADGAKGWVDFTDNTKADGLTALTVECWLNLAEKGVSGDPVCRNGLYMIRLAGGRAQASFWVDGGWRTPRRRLSGASDSNVRPRGWRSSMRQSAEAMLQPKAEI